MIGPLTYLFAYVCIWWIPSTLIANVITYGECPLVSFGEGSSLLVVSSYLTKAAENWLTRLFYKQGFFLTQSQCCLTFSWVEFQMLLRCCLIHNHHRTLTRLMISLFVSMSRPTSLYVVYMWCDLFFIFSLIFHNQLYNSIITDTLVFTHFFLEYVTIIFGS